MRIAVVAILGVLFAWLVLFKLLNRVLKRLGHSSPCPHQFGWLLDLRPSRLRRSTILDRMRLQPGATVLEIGPGVGTFTIEAARRIGPSGRLIAVDLQPEMIVRLKERLEKARITNAWYCVADSTDLPLPDHSVDHVLLIGVLPEIHDRRRALGEVRRVLQPSGVLSISEDFVDPDYPFPSETIRLVEAAGFEVAQRFGGPWLYILNFHR